MLVKINNFVIETQNVSYIVDREIFMNNGKSFTLLEPEIQYLLEQMFEEIRPMPVVAKEEPKKKVTRKQ